jgi:transposase-like protein
MPRPAAIDYAAAARRYGVSSRTARRWVKAGADLEDAASVAAHLLRMKRPAIKALKNLVHHLP